MHKADITQRVPASYMPWNNTFSSMGGRPGSAVRLDPSPTSVGCRNVQTGESCPSWHNRRTCRHVALAMEYELARRQRLREQAELAQQRQVIASMAGRITVQAYADKWERATLAPSREFRLMR